MAELNAAKLGFRNVNADIDLVLLKERGDRSVRGDEIARANIQNFHDRCARRNDLALAESGEVIRISGLGLLDVFSAVAAFQFFQIRLGLKIARFGGSDFFRAITALHSVILVLGHFLLRQGHFPIRF